MYFIWRFTLEVAEVFFGYNFPKPERICMQSGIEVWDHRAHLHKKLWEIAPGIPPNGAKTRFFSVTNTMRPFGHLSCTDVDDVWNNRRESMCRSIHRWKISKFLRRGFASLKKLLPEAVFWVGCLLPAHSSNVTISGDRNHFRGLVDIPRMCLLYASFDRGCTVWALWPPQIKGIVS